MTTTNKIREIAQQIVTDNFPHGYDPIFWDQGYADTHEEAVSLYVAGNYRWREVAYDVLDDWASDSSNHDAAELCRIYFRDNDAEDIDEFDLRDEIRDLLMENCRQDYALEWIHRMRNVAIRIQVDSWSDPKFIASGEEISPEVLLQQAGVASSEKNLAAAQTIIDNGITGYGGRYYNLFMVFQLALSDIEKIGNHVRITGEVELWAGNIYQGDGMSATVDVDVTIDRRLLSTDGDAAGYSYCDVFGTTHYYLPSPTVKFV